MTPAQRNVLLRPDTFHFNVGNIGAIALGATGVATPAAMAYFGQININSPRQITATHLHLIEDGAAPSVINLEFWRRRGGVMTQLSSVSYVAPAGADFITRVATPTGALAALMEGDYLFVQAVTGTTIAGGGNGLTADVHYDF
jgi:hypothetical protein